MTDVMITTPNGQMPAYVAAPAGAGPWPGVVVVHDFTGMSHDLRNQADWLASEGFLAAAPDLYYWGSRLRCLWTIMREVTAGKGRTVADIDAAPDWLAARADCTGRIGVIGFCMGGGYALALASSGLRAADSQVGMSVRHCEDERAYGTRHRSGWGSGRGRLRQVDPAPAADLGRQAGRGGSLPSRG